jgi:hypothetical protein
VPGRLAHYWHPCVSGATVLALSAGRVSARMPRPWERLLVSFDVYFQRFRDGDADPGGGERMRQVLQPFIVREEPEHHFALVEYGDGSADVYLDGDSMMANHISGEQPWELLVEGARAADWVILPVGCPTCITDEAQRVHLPKGLDEDVVLVSTGDEFLQVIRSS